jgi:hypothetical protein
MTGPFDSSLSMACEESQKAYNEWYYCPLYERGVTVKATDRGVVPPLIFPLRFNKNNHVCVLTFYDTAGENLDDKSGINIISSYITNAKGIIVLLDPLQVQKIRDLLSQNGFTALPAKNREIYDVLRTIEAMIRNVKNVIKGQIQIPLALVITKIDVLEHYNLLPKYSCLTMESAYLESGTFVRPYFENTNIEIETLIEHWIDDELLSYIKQFKKYSFFGVSALGGNPTDGGTKIGSQGISPRRVLDPFLWLLDENGYFNNTVKKIQNKLIGGLGEITKRVKKYI